MSDEYPPWANALEGLASELHRSDHPAEESLATYVEGELPADEADGIRDHLTSCRRCRQIVLDLQAFPELEPPSPALAIDAEQLEEEWRALEARRTRSAPDGSALAPVSIQGSRHGQKIPWAYAPWLQAALIVLCLGIGLWGAGERRSRQELADDLAIRAAEVEALTQSLDELTGRNAGALTNLQVVDLPSSSYTRSDRPTRQIHLSEGALGMLWILDIEDLELPVPEHQKLEVEIADANGNVIWSESGLHEVETGSITFAMAGGLPPGDYQVRLISESDGPVAEYSVTFIEYDIPSEGG